MKFQTSTALLLALALTSPVLAQDEAGKPALPASEGAPDAKAATPAPQDAEPTAKAADTAPRPAPSGAKMTLDFRGAKLGTILDYLSKEAGFVLINPVELPAPVTLVSKQPLSPAEAVDALNGVLFDQGYAVLVRGRTLRVVKLSDAKQLNIPVVSGGDPEKMPESDRMVTQVIPVRYASVKDLAENLKPLLNTTYSSLEANTSGNALILTDTQANVRRIASIVAAIDGGIGTDQQVKVFHLAHASSDKVAQVLTAIYGAKSGGSSQNIANMFGFGGGGGRNGGGGGRNGGGGGGGGSDTGGEGAARTEQVLAASDSGTNSVVVRASPGSILLIGKVVEQLDVDTTAREGVLVYQAHNAKSTGLALSLTNLFSETSSSSSSSTTAPQRNGVQNRQPAGSTSTPASGSNGDAALDLAGQVRVVSDDLSNSVMVLTQERNFPRIKAILESLDRPMRQVLVRVLVAEVTLKKDLDFGVELQGFHPADATGKDRLFSNFNLFDSTTGMNGYLIDNSHFQATVRALATNTRFDVLSRPSILTTDNQAATVNVSQNVPIITGTRTDVNNNLSTTVDRQDVGVILKVTPQINSEGHVVLDVDQTLSALSDQNVPLAGGAIAPIINKRQMTTRVAVDNGQTVVIGGLVQDSFTETVQQIPFLGDIPYLGELFKRTQRTKTKTELLMFLTPQVIQSPEELAAMTRQMHAETQQLNKAVEPGALERHIRQLQGLKVGEPVAPGTLLAPVTVPATPTEPGSPSTMAEAASRSSDASDKFKEAHP